MNPFINIFGRDISVYGMMLSLGIGSALTLVYFLCKARGNHPIKWWDGICISCFAIAGGFIGAFLLRPIMKLPQLIMMWQQLPENTTLAEIINFLFGEIVFYGGLIGGAITVLICSKKLIHHPVIVVADLAVPALALGHAFGRIGCLCGGCCWGLQVRAGHPLSVIYPPESLSAPSGIPLLAVPMIESVCLFIIAVILATVYLKVHKTGICAGIYLTLYPILRFILEFYRGDLVRGIYAGISTSQYISMGLFIVGVIILIYSAVSKPKVVTMLEDANIPANTDYSEDI